MLVELRAVQVVGTAGLCNWHGKGGGGGGSEKREGR